MVFKAGCRSFASGESYTKEEMKDYNKYLACSLEKIYRKKPFKMLVDSKKEEKMLLDLAENNRKFDLSTLMLHKFNIIAR